MWSWLFGEKKQDIGITAFDVSLKVHTLEARLNQLEQDYFKLKEENQELKNKIKHLQKNDMYLYDEIKSFKDKYLIRIG